MMNKVGQPNGRKSITLFQICVKYSPFWEEDGQMRQLDMSHGDVQIMIGTA